MKTFISASDIETLAAQGVRELTVDEDTVLTAVAREAAAQLGVKLVTPGSAMTTRPAAAPVAAASPAKPRGCQHGPLPAGASCGVRGRSSGGRINGWARRRRTDRRRQADGAEVTGEKS